MSTSRRAALILIAIVAGLCVIAYTGVLQAVKWQASTDSTVTRAYGDSDAFAPLFAPVGDWQVYIDAPTAIRKPLAAVLKQELPKLTASQCRIEVVTDVPAAAAGVNRLTVTLTPDGLWTPIIGRFADRAEIRIVTAGAVAVPDDHTVAPGTTRITVTYAVAARGFGLIGRPQMNAYRARVATDMISKAIRETFAEIRTKAGQ